MNRFPEWFIEKRRFAEKYIEKAREPKYGLKLDWNKFRLEAEKYYETSNIDNLPPEVKRSLENLVFPLSKNIAANIIHVDEMLVYKNIVREMVPSGVEIMGIEEAIAKYNWMKNYWFRAFPLTLNKLSVIHGAYSKGGAFIHVGENVKVEKPISSCFVVASSRYAQLSHSIVIAEPNSEIHILTGCTAPLTIQGSLHAGLTEVYVKKNARVVSTMIEYWHQKVHSRPLKAVIVEEGGEYIENFIMLKPGLSMQAYPTVILKGRNSSTVLRSIVIGTDSSDIDMGEAAYLVGENSRARLITRGIALDSSCVKQRTKVWSKASKSSGYVECSGLILGRKARLETYPTLQTFVKDTELYHESSIGKIAEDQLFYLISRGFSEEEATALMIRGFLDPDMFDLPEPLLSQVKSIIDLIVREAKM
ncbi:MAG TPA: SufD family Fe-S cluster assembly protein [Thermoprotei archaeon]|nr:SufD family Fe-S cluster assembly protein [Thermoprotei archaeon]